MCKSRFFRRYCVVIIENFWLLLLSSLLLSESEKRAHNSNIVFAKNPLVLCIMARKKTTTARVRCGWVITCVLRRVLQKVVYALLGGRGGGMFIKKFCF